MKATTQRNMLAAALLALALLLITASAFAASGDYGVATGASAASSGCGGTGQPPCTMTWNGHGVTYSGVDSNGYTLYTFDDFDCTLYINSSGQWSTRGDECDQSL